MVFVSGFLPLFFAITGFNIWRARRRVTVARPRLLKSRVPNKSAGVIRSRTILRREQWTRGPGRQIRNGNGLIAGSFVRTSAFAAATGAANEIGTMGPAPKAQCGPSDRTEKGLQGQTTSQERASGDSQRGYNCNLELVGQFRGEGAYSQDGPSFFGHCAYMATENNPRQAHPGIVVIDVSDPKNPRATAYLADTPAGLTRTKATR
jgi:hypothetical protein